MSQSGCRHLCAGTCRHAERCRHVCRHLDVPTRADTCWHMNVIWKLGCADMCQHLEGADTWEGADTSRCRHVPTPLGADTCWHMNVIWKLGCGWHMPAHPSLQIKKVHMISIRDVGSCRHLDVSARVGTFPGVGTFSGADTCQHIPVCK